jgi:hypothetical protein
LENPVNESTFKSKALFILRYIKENDGYKNRSILKKDCNLLEYESRIVALFLKDT